MIDKKWVTFFAKAGFHKAVFRSYHVNMPWRTIAADNGVGLHYIDDKLAKVVSTSPKAQAYRVTRSGNEIIEVAIKPELLGK